jgi:hypothetical protein
MFQHQRLALLGMTAMFVAALWLPASAIAAGAHPARTHACGSRTVHGYESLSVTARGVKCRTARPLAFQIYGLIKGGSCDQSPRRSCAFRIDGWAVRTRWARSGDLYGLRGTAAKSHHRVVGFLLIGE